MKNGTDQVVPNYDGLVGRRSRSGSDRTSPDAATPPHVGFNSADADDVDVNEKQGRARYLTAKYPKHQMGLIRRRIAVEDWMDTELKLLFGVSDEDYETYDTILDLDEILNLDTVEERAVYIQERIARAQKSEAVRQKFVTELLEKAGGL